MLFSRKYGGTPPDPHASVPLAFLDPVQFIHSLLIKMYLLVVLVFLKFARQSMYLVSCANEMEGISIFSSLKTSSLLRLLDCVLVYASFIIILSDTSSHVFLSSLNISFVRSINF